MITSALVALLCNTCGINLVIYFAPQILQSSGFDTDTSWLGTLGLGATNVVFTLVGMLTVDKIGRRPLLIGGAIGLTLCMTLLTSTFTFSPFAGSDWLALTPNTSSFSFHHHFPPSAVLFTATTPVLSAVPWPSSAQSFTSAS